MRNFGEKKTAKKSAIFNENFEISNRERGCFGQALFSPIFVSGFQSGAKECNEYLLAKFGFDTAENESTAAAAENEPAKV